MKIADVVDTPFDREEFLSNPLRCYGCGEEHASPTLGNRIGRNGGTIGCLGFIRGERDAIRVLCGALPDLGFTVITDPRTSLVPVRPFPRHKRSAP